MIKLEIADKQFLNKNNIKNEAYICTDGDKVLGICEYSTENGVLTLENIISEDNSIADGLIRQTMNYALDNGNQTCKFSENVSKKLFELRIIKQEDIKEIDILDFFLKLNCI